MELTKYLKVTVKNCKDEEEGLNQFNLMKSAVDTEIEELCHCQICKGWTCKDIKGVK